MRSVLLFTLALWVICVLVRAEWGGWYVDGSVSSSGDGTSWETAFQGIQEAIDSASNGDSVTVAQGTYVENIHFNGKNIILTSIDALDPDIVAATVIGADDPWADLMNSDFRGAITAKGNIRISCPIVTGISR